MNYYLQESNCVEDLNASLGYSTHRYICLWKRAQCRRAEKSGRQGQSPPSVFPVLGRQNELIKRGFALDSSSMDAIEAPLAVKSTRTTCQQLTPLTSPLGLIQGESGPPTPPTPTAYPVICLVEVAEKRTTFKQLFVDLKEISNCIFRECYVLVPHC